MIRRSLLVGLAAVILTGGVWASTATGAGGNGRGAFSDDDGSVHEHDINGFAQADITRGCNPPANDRFCPRDPVTRQQMASFLVRAFDLPRAEAGQFVDTAGSIHAADIDALAAAGITLGCNPPRNDRFCPTQPVTREQMASFLVRALELEPPESSNFVDISSSVHRRDIEALAAAGITKGCNPPDNTRFCPRDPVTREQMASFMVRALDGVEPIQNRFTLRDGIRCTKDGLRCSGRATLARGIDFDVVEGWYQVLPYRDNEEAELNAGSTNVAFYWNGVEVDREYLGIQEGDTRALKRWRIDPPRLTRGTYTLQAVWRWNGATTQTVTYTITVP
jgi:hypothetical protein